MPVDGSRSNVSPARSSEEINSARQLLIERVSSVALLILDERGHVLTWGTGAEKLKGYRADEILGRHFSTFYTPEANAVGHPQRELDIASLTGSYTEDGWRVRKDGTRFWARVTILALRDEEDDVKYFGKVTLDLTAERQKEEQVQNVLALLDQTMRLDHLTGLPNRRAWDEQIAELIASSWSRDRSLAVAILDLDHFKDYNDRQGHVAGDNLLRRSGIRWREVLRAGDVLARYGGEEFVVAMPGCDYVEAEHIVQRMMTLTPDGCTLSAGIAMWDGEDVGSELLDRADRALYAAKDAGRNCIRIAEAKAS